KFVMADGTVEELPVISGNSLRGRLRDLGMAYFCRALGFGRETVNPETGEVTGVPGLPLPAFYLLFSGGSLSSGEGAKALDLRAVQRLQALIPLLGVFGGAVGNHSQAGKLIVDKAYPICAELNHLLPEPYHSEHYIWRSEEHTSELQSREKLVCRLLLEKKNHSSKSDNIARRDDR